MRAYLIGAAVVVVVVGGAWLVLAFAFGSLHTGADAWTRSAACVRRDPSLAQDPKTAARFVSSGLKPLGITWRGVRAVGLFSDSLAPDSVDKADAGIVAALQRQGVSPAEIASRLEHQDNLSLYYVDGTPSKAAQTAIGRCVYLVHYNRIASALGIYISPHAELPFLPGHHRHERD
jgi:hypothetical protein